VSRNLMMIFTWKSNSRSERIVVDNPNQMQSVP
jgi:hypothetical protein